MTEAEIRRAKIGDRVTFITAGKQQIEGGTITHRLTNHVEVTWDDGDVISYDANPASGVHLA